MNDKYDAFYREKAKTFKKYAFHESCTSFTGKKLNFAEYLRTFANEGFTVLDMGCGSGELTIELSPSFKNVIGIDPYDEYIKSAKELKKEKRAKNVTFKVADGKRLPFENEYFDIVISSRGPLSADIEFMRESVRVLKKEGLMIEETIGEKDKMELKKIFRRGQNYPIQKTKISSVRELLKQTGMKPIYTKYFTTYELYPSINDVITALEHAPIIPNFNKRKDKSFLDEVDRTLHNGQGIILRSHRLLWVARKHYYLTRNNRRTAPTSSHLTERQ